MKRILLVATAGLLAAACASAQPENAGRRPPEGRSPSGTDFGNWTRDAEGSVDRAFSSQILGDYKIADAARARRTLETDGFHCVDGNRPDGRPVPELECTLLYKFGEDVHTWSVEFWPAEARPRARYARTHIRDRNRNYDEKQRRG